MVLLEADGGRFVAVELLSNCTVSKENQALRFTAPSRAMIPLNKPCSLECPDKQDRHTHQRHRLPALFIHGSG
jgi:hypothetical protein